MPLRQSLHILLHRGKEEGVFKRGMDPVQAYVTIAALSCFHLANPHILSALLGKNLIIKAIATGAARSCLPGHASLSNRGRSLSPVDLIGKT